jgi:hypothetical protein
VSAAIADGTVAAHRVALMRALVADSVALRAPGRR